VSFDFSSSLQEAKFTKNKAEKHYWQPAVYRYDTNVDLPRCIIKTECMTITLIDNVAYVPCLVSAGRAMYIKAI